MGLFIQYGQSPEIGEVNDKPSWQEEVVKAALKGTNTIMIQSTGNGKSLCYQILPFVTGGSAVVISPNLNLIHDQIEELCVKAITSTYPCSTQNNTSIPAAITRGEFKVVYMYVTPERMLPGYSCEPNPFVSIPGITWQTVPCCYWWGILCFQLAVIHVCV